MGALGIYWVIGIGIDGMDCATDELLSIGRLLWFAALSAFCLSLCNECLQLVLKVGYFDVMDLVLNTLGGFVGALISVGVRKVVRWLVRQISPLAGAGSR